MVMVMVRVRDMVRVRVSCKIHSSRVCYRRMVANMLRYANADLAEL